MSHITLSSSQTDIQSKQTRCASIATGLHGAAAVGYSTRNIFTLGAFVFSDIENGSERKGLSTFTGKFPSSTAGLHLVMNTSCLRKKSRLVHYRMVECFHAITIGAKHLYFRCEQLLFFLREINRFLETLSSFCIFKKALFLDPRDSILETRDSILETRSSNVSRIEARGSRIESRVSSVNLLLSGTVHQVEYECELEIHEP